MSFAFSYCFSVKNCRLHGMLPNSSNVKERGEMLLTMTSIRKNTFR